MGLKVPSTIRDNGVYNTPADVADLLSEWAIRSPTDVICEPSFGSGRLLQAASARLRKLGCRHPSQGLWGCDIRVEAFSSLHTSFDRVTVDIDHFQLTDFLELESFGPNRGFDAFIGNPPFRSVCHTSNNQRNSARHVCKRFSLGSNQNLWSLFILQSMQFTRLGGRAAWVVPIGSFDTNYGEEALAILAENFSRIQVIPVSSPLFLDEGTSQRAALLLLDGYQNKLTSSSVVRRPMNSLQNLAQSRLEITADERKKMLFEQAADAVRERIETLRFDTLAHCGIGVPTGDVKFFTFSEMTRRNNSLSEPFAVKAVTSSKHLDGLRFKSKDWALLRSNNSPCFMLRTEDRQLDEAVCTYLDKFPVEKRDAPLVSSRAVWHELKIAGQWDGFMVYCNRFGPRLVLNEAGAVCTNSLHKVVFKPGHPAWYREYLSLALLSSWGRYWAESAGRVFNGATIKLEPGDFASFEVPKPADSWLSVVGRTFLVVDDLIRAGDVECAIRRADQLIRKVLGTSVPPGFYEEVIQNAARKIRDRRNSPLDQSEP